MSPEAKAIKDAWLKENSGRGGADLDDLLERICAAEKQAERVDVLEYMGQSISDVNCQICAGIKMGCHVGWRALTSEQKQEEAM